MRLDYQRHDRDNAGLTYVYPVVSRRARGVSIGLNLNPNNACNWRCIYCQVPGLVYGNAPEIDLDVLAEELGALLEDVVRGDFMERHVPEGSRRLNDVALSGNGEPTSSPQFAEVLDVVARALERHELLGQTKVVLITNGSLVHKPAVQGGLRMMERMNGEVWFKLDSATDEGMRQMNSSRAGIERHVANLVTCAGLCPTWIQTMVLQIDGQPPSEKERGAYLARIAALVAEHVPVEGVLLYGLARTVHQPEAPRLSPVDRQWLEAFARDIEARGLKVALHE